LGSFVTSNPNGMSMPLHSYDGHERIAHKKKASPFSGAGFFKPLIQLIF